MHHVLNVCFRDMYILERIRLTFVIDEGLPDLYSRMQFNQEKVGMTDPSSET